MQGRALRMARSRALALIVPGVSSPLFADLLAGAEEAADEADYTLLIGRSDRVTVGGDTIRRLVGEGRVDGFVLQRSDDLSDQALESLVANDARIVLVTSRTPGRRGSVILDDVAGARVATEHLISLGHTRIALVGGIPSSDIARRREQGYALGPARRRAAAPGKPGPAAWLHARTSSRCHRQPPRGLPPSDRDRGGQR